jgi:hypothetical protein
MSDELVKRAREAEASMLEGFDLPPDPELLGGLAARIEALEGERDGWKAQAEATASAARACFDAQSEIEEAWDQIGTRGNKGHLSLPEQLAVLFREEETALAASEAKVARLTAERDEARADVVAFSEMAAALVEDMSKRPQTTWGQVRAAIRALGDIGDRKAYHARAEAALAASEAKVARLVEALRYMREVYSKPDERMCCDGRECGCYGATTQQYADYIADEALASVQAQEGEG